MKIKLITLNIWKYYDWEKRKDKLINFLKKENADIILFQEACFDERLKDKYENQVDEINQILEYPYFEFGKVVKMTKLHKQAIDWEMYFGLGIISKYKIKKSEVIILDPVETDRNMGFLHICLETTKGDVDIINVHFENKNKGAKEQLKKTLEWCKKKKLNPIIAGDFNMKITSDLFELAKDDFEISYDAIKYFSFYPTEHSVDKVPVTLDYIIVHKKKFKIIDISCMNTHATDHRALISNIDFR